MITLESVWKKEVIIEPRAELGGRGNMGNVRLDKRKYELWKCLDCKNITAYTPHLGDGRMCPVCGGNIFISIGIYKRDRDG